MQYKYKGSFEGWYISYITKNKWRINEVIYNHDDLVQEGHVIFYKLLKTYDFVDDPKWFMSLFQRAVVNRFNDLSSETTKHRCLISNICYSPDGEFDLLDTIESNNLLDYTKFIHKLSSESRQVLSVLINCPDEILKLLNTAWRNSNKRNSLGNKHLIKLLGIDSNDDLIENLRNEITEE